MVKRICFSGLFLLSMMFLPFWFSLLLVFVGVALFPVFWESVIFLLIMDLIYGVKQDKFWGLLYVSSLFGVCFLVLFELLKKKLKFYRR